MENVQVFLSHGVARAGRALAGTCILLCMPLCMACQRERASSTTDEVPPQPVPAAPGTTIVPTDSPRTLAYVCPDSFAFAVQVGRDSAWLLLQERRVGLRHSPAASGVRYSDGATTFWTEGDSATLEHEGRAHAACLGNRALAIWEDARLRGVDFRALGQEPGWLLEIDEGNRIDLLLDYGEKRVVAPAPPPQIDTTRRQTTYRVQTETHQLEIVTRNEPCSDVMSGERYPTVVEITVDGRTYRGCGRVL